MFDRAQIRITSTPTPRSSLHFSRSVTLLTPVPHQPLPKCYYHTKLSSVAPAVILDKKLLLTKPVGHSLTPLSHNSIALLPDYIFLSLTQQSFPAWGLPAERKLQAAQRIPKASRRYVNVRVSLKNNEEGMRKRARWALTEERVGCVDFVVSSGSTPVSVPDTLRGETCQITAETTGIAVEKDQIPELLKNAKVVDDASLLDTLDFVQMLGTTTTCSGDMEMTRTRYDGFCSSELTGDCMMSAIECVKNGAEWAAVLVAAPDAAVVWKGGIGRGGAEEKWGGAGEIFIMRPGETVVAQMRSGSDVA